MKRLETNDMGDRIGCFVKRSFGPHIPRGAHKDFSFGGRRNRGVRIHGHSLFLLEGNDRPGDRLA